MNESPDGRQPVLPEGLCAACRHARRVVNDRGSRFVRCLRADGTPAVGHPAGSPAPAFPRYPHLPVRRCDGFEPDPGGGGVPGRVAIGT